MRESDWFVLPWKHWLFHRLYGIVLVFQGTGGRWIYGCCKAKIRCKALPCAGAVRSCRLFSPDGSPGRAAALCRLLSADQSDLYRSGHGVGIFHIAPNPAPKRPAMAAAGLRDGRAVAVSARGQVSLFQQTMPLRAICGICIMCRRSLRRCSACSPRCSSGGGRTMRFLADGICCSFRRCC